MPPFKSGLLKRKVNAPSAKVGSLKVSSDDESSNSSEEQELIQDQGGINPEGDATDSENEEENSAVSDEEQDEVLYQDEAEWSAGSGAEGDAASADGRHSTDLEDSDASDSDAETSNNIREDEDNDAEDEAADDEIEKTESSKDTKSHPHADTNNKILIKSRQNTRHKKEDNKKESNNTSMDRLACSIRGATLTPVVQRDEYESGDTSDEEDRRTTVGAVPAWWYREYPHLGYDLDGRRLLRPPQRDRIDDFLKSCSEPEFWRTVRDPATGQDVLLSRDDLLLLQRLQHSRVPNANHDEYEEWVEWFSGSVLATPVRAFPEHKRSFLPSRADARAVARLAHALRMGWAKTRRQERDERRANKEKRFYDLWGSGADATRAPHRPIAAPRRALPAHAESYNPPPEYLLDDKEMKEWERQAETPWKRKYTFLPTRHGALRSVPAYPRFVRERFLRCLDLYLAPRAIKMRLTISPEQLVPRLPAPRDLQPFPTREALALRGHAGAVRSAAFDPSGQHVVSGGDDCTVRVWETSTGRCVRTVELGARVACVAWAPAAGLALLAAGAGARLLLLSAAGAASQRAVAATDAALRDPPPDTGHQVEPRTASCVTWDAVGAEQWARGSRLALTHFRAVTHVSWHARGDYVCVTLADGASRSVLVHQLSRRRSQLPFARAKGLVQAAVFHPTRPVLFVATQRCVRMYDLVKQELVRKLSTGAQWISCLAPHPAGDNLLVGSYDRKCIWFDLELSGKPYQTLRLHGGAVRALAFHARYPLFASAGDDDNIVVSHGMVYNDLLQNPLLVPLKQLAGPARRDALCVLALAWHPSQPWLLAAGADHTLRLYS